MDFGTGFAGRVLSKAARAEKSTFTPYDRLPAELRAGMTRREYENTHVRGDEDEEDGDGGGLLPVVVFCFSKKKTGAE